MEQYQLVMVGGGYLFRRAYDTIERRQRGASIAKGRWHHPRKGELAGDAGVGLGRLSWKMADGDPERP